MIAEYRNTVLEERNNADVINAIGHVAKAVGGQIQVNPMSA